MFPATIDRVPQNTDAAVNEQIRQQARDRVHRIAASGTAAINRRIKELDHEWDFERYLETMAPSFTLLGLTLGLTRHRGWFLLPLVVQTFFLQHALQGWCPPIPVLRRLGIRTYGEIEEERYALKALRGDFRDVGNGGLRSSDEVSSALQAARQ
jgi:hypothetical protein